MKQPEHKTLEISVVDFMAREEFVDENGIIPQVLANYNLGKDDILFSGTVDLSNLSVYQDSLAGFFWRFFFRWDVQ